MTVDYSFVWEKCWQTEQTVQIQKKTHTHTQNLGSLINLFAKLQINKHLLTTHCTQVVGQPRSHYFLYPSKKHYYLVSNKDAVVNNLR